jgi:hypothetical protein
MKVRARLAWLLALVLVLGVAASTATTAAGSPPARTGSSVATASTVPTVLQSMTVTAPTTSLVGTALTTMTVSVRLVDPDGVVPRVGGSMDRSWDCPCVALEPVTSTGAHFHASPQSTASGSSR